MVLFWFVSSTGTIFIRWEVAFSVTKQVLIQTTFQETTLFNAFVLWLVPESLQKRCGRLSFLLLCRGGLLLTAVDKGSRRVVPFGSSRSLVFFSSSFIAWKVCQHQIQSEYSVGPLNIVFCIAQQCWLLLEQAKHSRYQESGCTKLCRYLETIEKTQNIDVRIRRGERWNGGILPAV